MDRAIVSACVRSPTATSEATTPANPSACESRSDAGPDRAAPAASSASLRAAPGSPAAPATSTIPDSSAVRHRGPAMERAATSA
ncbi:hypothetical protein ACFQY7_44280 [Actinomadura luteofluorescens]|uniref:hypothetical protein n=1 Tax=Actinomadura luteofluorescens TaxID=46163 RepID=UPI00362B3CD8